MAKKQCQFPVLTFDTNYNRFVCVVDIRNSLGKAVTVVRKSERGKTWLKQVINKLTSTLMSGKCKNPNNSVIISRFSFVDFAALHCQFYSILLSTPY